MTENNFTAANADRIALISCSKLKKPYRCEAHELYSASELFSLSYRYVREVENVDRVYILSTKHGLVRENEIIEPYEKAPVDMTTDELKAWAQSVFDRLSAECDINKCEFIVMAGKSLYEELLPLLPHAELPLRKMNLEERLSFLKRALAGSAVNTAAQTSSGEAIFTLNVGDRVRHAVLGIGTVAFVREGKDPVADIDFDSEGSKRFSMNVAQKCIEKI